MAIALQIESDKRQKISRTVNPTIAIDVPTDEYLDSNVNLKITIANSNLSEDANDSDSIGNDYSVSRIGEVHIGNGISNK